MRYVKGKDGKFKGAIGDAGTHPPTASQVPGAAPAGTGAMEPAGTVDAAYEQFKAATAAPEAPAGPVNTYPARYARYEEASAAYEQAQAVATAARQAAGGKACAPGNCSRCGHGQHVGRNCNTTVQVMSDVWDACGCDTNTPPTSEQVLAHDAAKVAYEKYQDMDAARDAAEQYREGDLVSVARGRKVPIGSEGPVLRTYNGDYGLRVLFRNTDGEEAWVAATNVERPL